MAEEEPVVELHEATESYWDEDPGEHEDPFMQKLIDEEGSE